MLETAVVQGYLEVGAGVNFLPKFFRDSMLNP